MKNFILVLVMAAVAFAGTTVDLWPILNGKGGTGAFILRDSVWTNTAAGVYANVGLVDTSNVIYLKGSTMFHTYQWQMDKGTDDAISDSCVYSEAVICSSAVLGAWIPGYDMRSNVNVGIDTVLAPTWGSSGKGSYEAYLSRCDAVRFIMRVNAETHDTDTVKVVKRGLKVE